MAGYAPAALPPVMGLATIGRNTTRGMINISREKSIVEVEYMNYTENLTKDKARMGERTNELQIFNNKEFGQVRTIEIDGKPYFVANDVAKALEYANPSDATNTHCKHSEMVWGSDSLGRRQRFKVIPEGDMYRLITHSKLETAERFESWVFDEVIPSIRKTGGYINNADIFVNTYFGELSDEQKNIVKSCLISIEEKQKKINNLENENNLLAQKTLEWADRPLINALVRAYAHSINDDFRAAWTDFKKELLYRHSINLNLRITAYLNQTGKKTKPKTLGMLDDSELPQALSTAVALCRNNNVDVSNIIEKKAS